MIDTDRLNCIFGDCFLTEKEIDENGKPLIEIIEVKGIVNNFGFHPDRVKKHENEIIGFLNELPGGFKSSEGGGCSFLNACIDKHGNQWGEHRNMEQLFALGIAIGKEIGRAHV